MKLLLVARKSLHERLFNFNHTLGTGAVYLLISVAIFPLEWPPGPSFLPEGCPSGAVT